MKLLRLLEEEDCSTNEVLAIIPELNRSLVGKKCSPGTISNVLFSVGR